MDSQDLQVLAALRRWGEEGHRAALITVAQTWGSAPRPAGAWMALRDDGRVQTYRIVGEDEADPKAGTISYVSPVARLLSGKAVGDVARLGGQELEITAIS